MMKKLVSVIIVVFLFCLAILPASAAEDELIGLELEKEMRAILEQGIIKGYTDGTVRPKGEVTREQFAAFITRALELPAQTSTFTDVHTSRALASAIGAIQKTGIMKGNLENNFLPEKKITREEMAITMSRVLDYKDISISVDGILLADAKNFGSAEGINAAKLNIAAKLINGTAKNTADNSFVFSPKNVSQRDQSAAVIYRFIALMESQETPAPKPEPTPEPIPKPEPMPEPIPKPEPLPEPTPVDPTVFQVASVVNGEMIKTDKKYATYDEAVSAYAASSNVAIYKGNDVIKIKSGIAYAADISKNYASIYEDENFKTEVTYTSEGREMKYVGSGPNYVIVQVGGTVGYAKHSEVNLTPTQALIGKDRYEKDGSGMLIHYLFNHITQKQAGNYQVGPAPDFMEPFIDYTSYDGVHFYDTKGSLKGTFYPYFQFQSVRQPTNYTTEELDYYILTVLAEKEATNLPRYANATTTSKIKGLGSYLKEMEATYKVNAMFILAAAMHESDFGTSKYAKTINNLFGIGVFDSDPNATMYAKPENSVFAFVTRFINANYGLPGAKYANGLVPGNKTTGFNVKYASDPYWGAKIAGHMYRIDIALGDKDYMQETLAMTNANGILNVRATSEVNNSNLLYTFAKKELGINAAFGYPVIIVDREIGADGYYWYKVLTDTPTAPDYGYIRGDYLNIIE